jgi:hypothetical protein
VVSPVDQGQPVLPVSKVQPVLTDVVANQVCPEPMVPPVSKDQRVRPASVDDAGHKDCPSVGSQERWARLDHKDNPASDTMDATASQEDPVHVVVWDRPAHKVPWAYLVSATQPTACLLSHAT